MGECTLDRYPALGATRVGGISLNFAIQARLAGAHEVSLVSCIGTDAGSDAIPAWLRDAGVSTSALHQLPGRTASQVIRHAAGAERFFPPGGYDPGVLVDFRLSEADLEVIRAADVVAVPCFQEIAHLFDAVVQDTARRGVLVGDLLDGAELGADLAGIEPLLGAFDLLFLSGGAAAVGRLMTHCERSGTLVVITHGAAGSTALLNGHCHTETAVPVPLEERVDTTGCGDAFQAAFTVSYFREHDVPVALRAGAVQAAQVIRHLGATAERTGA